MAQEQLDHMSDKKASPTYDRTSGSWQICAEDFPEDGDFYEKMRFLIAYAVLAPSAHNAQPWLFVIEESAVALYADRSRRLAHVDPEDRELLISCGAALEFLALALRRFGFDHTCTMAVLGDEADFIARLCVTGTRSPSPHDRMVFAAIQARRTTRRPFEPLMPPPAALEAWQHSVVPFNVDLKLISDETHRLAVAELTGMADMQQFADPLFRAELSTWIHRIGSGDGLSASGYPGAVLFAPVEALLIRNIDMGRGIAARDRQLAAHTPIFGLLSTAGDRHADWVETGRALAALLLTVTAWGAAAAFLNQAIEVPSLRVNLQREGRLYPQLLLRLGYGPVVKPSARRPVSDVIRLHAR